MFNDKKAIITGITGYIGSNLARALVRSGWDIAGIIRPSSETECIKDIIEKVKLNIYDGNISGLITFFRTFQPTIVLHLASSFIAEHKYSQVTDLIQSNILFGAHLLEAMHQTDVNKLVNTGTSWQHYNNDPYNPVCLYAACKESFEKIIEFYVKAKNFNVVTLKFFDIYGPDDPRKKLIQLFLKISQTGECLLMSQGEQQLDLVYIDDVIDSFIKTIELLFSQKIAHEKYAITTGNPITLKKIAKIFEKVSQTHLNIKWGGRPYRNREVMRIWNKGNSLPNWYAKYNLEEGLKKILSKK